MSAAPPTSAAVPPSPEAPLGRREFLASQAIFLVLITVYQTLVLGAVTDDVIRKGIEADSYDMIWSSVSWGVAILVSLFVGMGVAGRVGVRITLAWGLVFFALGNLLCGAAVDLTTMVLARAVEGVGKGMTIAMGRAALYKQFDRLLVVAIGFYGVCAYATRPITPLLTAYLNDRLSWRWIYWINVPLALLGLAAVLKFLRPDRPAKGGPHAKVDGLAIGVFVAWIVCLMFAFSWYRKWGGWSSNEFVAVVGAIVALPVFLVLWLGSGISPDEHLRRLLHSRVYILAWMVRLLLLLNLGAVVSIMGTYLTELRDEPRVVAGWVMAPAGVAMAATTLLTTFSRLRAWKHGWLFVGVIGAAACLWWISTLDNFTAKEDLALRMACWGACIGLFAPVFLTDELIEVAPKDRMYASTLAIVGLIVPLLTVPTMAGTVIKEWSDRALDVYRANLAENRPPVAEAAGRVADYYRMRGLAGADLRRETSTVLGTFAATESAAVGFQRGFRFLSLVVLGLGLAIATPLALATRAPPP